MKLIEQNPFRILGIPVNASAIDLAANKGKMRLLDIGRDVTFPLDLPGLLPSANRSKEAVATAERDINLPQDKVKYALFWFAQPSDPLGKLAYYDHLLQGDVAKAQELFLKRSSWEAQLCLSVLELQQGKYCDAILDFYFIANEHCSELCNAVAGQTFTMNSNELVLLYLRTLATEIDASTLLQEWNNDNRVLPGGSEIIEFELRNMATDAPIKTIEKEIATAKSVDSKDAQAQLDAGKRLSNNTHKIRIQLQKLIGDSDPRYSRLVDKLANQILQCSINYFNNIEGENREIVENALKLGEYALKIAVGKMARDHILHNVDILRKKKENLPPAEVESEVFAIMNALSKFVDLPDKIEHSLSLLNNTRPYLLTIKSKLGNSNSLYLKLSTQVVANALHNLIEEVNSVQKRPQLTTPDGYSFDSRMMDLLDPPKERLMRVLRTVKEAWDCIKIMDTFDMESDFRTNRYNPNRTSLQNMNSQLSQISSQLSSQYNRTYSSGTSSSSSGGCYIATMVYGSYDHPQVMVLRGFRDDVLQQNPLGRAFVKFYYKYSPTWVEYLKDKKLINSFIRKILDGFIKIYNK